MWFRFWVSCLIFHFFIFHAQENRHLYMKGNAFFIPLGILNGALEYELNKKNRLQGEIFISPWKSFFQKNAQIYMAGLDFRHYLKKNENYFIIGGNFSMGVFDIQKWTYWQNQLVESPFEKNIFYNTKNYYQRGFSLIIGVVLGYEYQWNEKWNLEFFLALGSIQSFYRSYDKITGMRTDNLFNAEEKNRKWNRSGEFLPYKGGIMLSYKIF